MTSKTSESVRRATNRSTRDLATWHPRRPTGGNTAGRHLLSFSLHLAVWSQISAYGQKIFSNFSGFGGEMASRFRRIGLLLCIPACALGLAVTANAHDAYDSIFKTGNTFWDCDQYSATYAFCCQTDNLTVRWFPEPSIGATAKVNINAVLENSFQASGLEVQPVSTAVYTGLSETDIIYQQGPLDPKTLGVTWCDDALTAVLCDQHYVRFASTNPLVRTICHESGHAVGLTHGAQAYPAQPNGLDDLHCMQTPIDEITDTVIGPHNSHQVSSTY